jgi:hypothetical protein
MFDALHEKLMTYVAARIVNTAGWIMHLPQFHKMQKVKIKLLKTRKN